MECSNSCLSINDDSQVPCDAWRTEFARGLSLTRTDAVARVNRQKFDVSRSSYGPSFLFSENLGFLIVGRLCVALFDNPLSGTLNISSVKVVLP